MKDIMFLLFALLFTPWLSGQEIDFTILNSRSDWEKLLQNAGTEKKIIFLDIYATWCGPCKMMDSRVYTDSSLAVYFNSSFINAKIDGEIEFGRILARQYKLTAYPTMIFINPGQEPVFTVVGYRDPSALSGIGKQVIDHGDRLITLGAKYDEQQLNADEEKEYLILLLAFDQKERFQRVAAGTLAKLSEEDIYDPSNKDIIINGGGDIGSNVVSVILKNPAHFKSSWGIAEFSRYLSGVFNTSMQNAIRMKDEQKMDKIVNEFIPVFLEDSPEQITRAKFTTRKIYFSQTKNWDAYISLVEDFYISIQNPERKIYYDEVYYIIENRLFEDQILSRALIWINKQIETGPDFEAFFLGTLIHAYRKDFDQAEFWLGRAEPLARSDEEKKSVTELRSYLEKLKSGSPANE
jgi:thiol-disulfide isomerase/thioredoxin